MTLMGGIDASIVDRVDSTEEEIRKEVRKSMWEYAPHTDISFHVLPMEVLVVCFLI